MITAGLPAVVRGQTLSGRVVDGVTGQPLAGVSVKIAGSTNGTSTDNEGVYQFINLREGRYDLEFSFVGMKIVRKEVRLTNNRHETLDIRMEENVSALGEVTVEARHERKELGEARKQGVPVSVIDGKLLAGRGTSIAEVINHQTGVKVRQTGGAGSDTKINVRGLEGNRVQIYLDGHALNTPDGSFSINDIPLQFIDRIEIYKGIVPPEFGGDGLGSAINVVTIDAEGSYYDAWYSRQSYGANEGSLLYKHLFPKQKLYATGMVGVQDAKNNYTINSPYIEGLRIKRDHDHYRRIEGAIEFELTDAWWDECELELPFFISRKEIQGIETNIRHARTSGWITGAELHLEKAGFFADRLDMKFSGVFFTGANQVNDTSSYIYSFSGGRVANTYRGEVGSVPNLSDDPFRDYRYRLNLKYRLLPSMNLNFNNDFRFVHTETRDTLADSFLHTNYSGFTTGITTVISSFNVENKWFDERLSTMLTGRHYYNRFSGKTVDMTHGTNIVPDYTREQQHNYGYSFAVRYDFARSWLLKLALEHNCRLPKSEELLGDRVQVIPNPRLKPERAGNYNLGVMFDRYYDGFRRLQFESNAYMMSISDMMMIRPSNYYMGYYNLGKALLWGLDAEAKWDASREWFFMLNATYQKAIDKMRYVAGTQTPNVTYNRQIPHIPIFFTNWSADYRKDNLFGGRGQYSRFYYEGGYTGKYYYGYNLTANQNFVIPSSCIHTVGAEYAILDRRVLFSLECHNLFNTKELTNLNYPLAGRTVQAKVRLTTLKW